MALNLNANQKVYIELTNPIHGGEGWDFGEVLWSPSRGSSGKDTWRILRDIKPGDLIIHSVKFTGKSHQFTGTSIVKLPCKEVFNEPPIPGRWAGYNSYFKIQLQDYSPFQKSILIQDFLVEYRARILKLGSLHSFYVKDVTSISQKYVAAIPDTLFELLQEFFEKDNIKLFDSIAISNEDDIFYTEYFTQPPKITTMVTRTVRDTKITKDLKKQYQNKCQICGRRIQLPNGNGYSEGHHLKKLGGIHKGPDVKENIIILCPYHHTEFDFGIIGIKDNKIIHLDLSNEFNGMKLAYERTDLNKEFLKYHMTYIFNK